MRAAPALRLTLITFGAWHSLLIVLALLDVACLIAWALLRSDPISPSAWTTVLAGAALCGLTAGSLRGRAVGLGWDGQSWSLAEPDAAPDARTQGEVGVWLDLGCWMLLRFTPAGRGRAAATWLPVQRHGLQHEWHALRCALFSPRATPATQDFAQPL